MKIKTGYGPSFPQLTPNALHLWSATLDEQAQYVKQFKSWLSPPELQRASRLKSERVKNHFIVGRGILKDILSRYLHIPPCEVHLVYEKLGKPHLESTLQNIIPRLAFNLSHSEGFIIYGISNQSLGIDLEYREKKRPYHEIAKRFFSTQEVLEIKQAQGEQKKIIFYNIWTKKEALLKALGLGLHTPLNQFAVTGELNSLDQFSNLPFDPNGRSWAVFSLNERPDHFSLSIALNRLPQQIHFWSWKGPIFEMNKK